MSSISDRYRLILKRFRINQGVMADRIGADSDTVGRWIKEGRMPHNFNHIEGMQLVLGVNLDWLETGEGEMLLDGVNPQIPTKTSENTSL